MFFVACGGCCVGTRRHYISGNNTVFTPPMRDDVSNPIQGASDLEEGLLGSSSTNSEEKKDGTVLRI